MTLFESALRPVLFRLGGGDAEKAHEIVAEQDLHPVSGLRQDVSNTRIRFRIADLETRWTALDTARDAHFRPSADRARIRRLEGFLARFRCRIESASCNLQGDVVVHFASA